MIRALALLAVGILLPGPAVSAAEPVPPSVQQSWTSLLVSPEWLEDNLDRRDLVILHASNDGSDYAEGHIPGARLIRLDQLTWAGENGEGVELRPWGEIRGVLEQAGVNTRSTVVVYGSNPMFAARLWMTLDVGRIGTPYFLDGGLQLWREEGRPLTTELPNITPGRVFPNPNRSRLIKAEWILARLGHEDMTLVDARSTDEFTGASGGPGGGLTPGHIPGARQLNWEELFESRERPIFLSQGELASKFSDTGAVLGDRVVAYCHTGLRASVVYMIARMLGYDARIYDGSWRDWGSRDYPAISSGGGGGR